jgi:superfamily II RNA helicase
MNCSEIEEIILFPFKLDKFQEDAMLALLKGENVLCTAATGSGKTAISEFAIALAVKKNKRAIYTAPIKALSNQKYGELQCKNKFKQKFEVGIKTGDLKVNPDAQVLVGTTEVFNNLLYTEPSYFDNVCCLIIDEAHYIRDIERGTVYEEIITMCPKECALVLLSATIPGAEKFALWVESIKGIKCGIYSNKERVVPLTHMVYWDGKLSEIMNNEKVIYEKNYRELLANWKEYRYGEKSKVQSKAHKKKQISKTKLLEDFIENMKERNLLPALFFVFSRKKCETMAKMFQKNLLSGKESTVLLNLYDFYVKKFLGGENGLRISQVWTIRSLLEKGVCVHHSGIIPILKEIIEHMFQKGLIKLLFCTTSLACGVNMPVKTAIFGETQMFDGVQRSLLKPELYYQCAGRAGRRGLDTKGTVIYFPINEDMLSFSEISEIFHGALTQIKSKFEMNPILLLKCFSIEKSPYDLFENSLMSFEVNEFIIGEMKKSKLLQNDVEGLEKTILQNIEEQHKQLIDSNFLSSAGKETIANMLVKKEDDFKEICKIEMNILSVHGNAKKKMLKALRNSEKQFGACFSFFSTENTENEHNATINPLLSRFREKDKIMKEILKVKRSMNEAEDYIIETVKWQIEVLKETGYINLSSDDLKCAYNNFIQKKTKILPSSSVTLLGKVAAVFNELESFFMAEFLLNYFLGVSKNKKSNMNMTTKADLKVTWSFLLGMLVNLEHHENNCDEDSFSIQCFFEKQGTGKDIIDSVLEKVKKLSGALENCKVENRLKNVDFELNYKFGCCLYLWVHGSMYSDIESLNLCDLFEGNFVKNILKIHNICEELKQACHILGESEYVLLFEEIQSTLIKDIVVIDSLYVTT